MFFFTACPPPEDPDTLDVKPSILKFSSFDEEEQSFDVITNVPEWDVKVIDGEWITTRKEGNKLFVKVGKYTSTSRARTATITIKAGLAKGVNVTVEQSAMNSLSLNPSSVIYKVGEIGDKTVTVTTNASSWKAESTAEWLKITQLNNSLRISVNGANSGASDRTADIIISAGTAQTTLKVTQEGIPIISYDSAECRYLGNIDNAGTACFSLRIFDKIDRNKGFCIVGYSTLPTNFNNFKIDAGTYSVASTGALKTFASGSVISESSVGGTCVFDFNSKKFTTITGGTFSVETSDNNYTIVTDFIGKDYTTGATVENIRLMYSGQISFEDYATLQFEDITKSNYFATCTPYRSALSTWGGEIIPYGENKNQQYYRISNWVNAHSVYLDYIDGEIFIDNDYVIGYDSFDSSLKCCFRAFTVSGDEWIEIKEYKVIYDKITRTLDFGSTYEGKKVYIGIVSISGSNITGYPDVYTNVKLVLSSSGNAQFSGEALHTTKIPNIINLDGKELELKQSSKNDININNISMKGVTIRTNDE